jgi:hypothetical protein
LAIFFGGGGEVILSWLFLLIFSGAAINKASAVIIQEMCHLSIQNEVSGMNHTLKLIQAHDLQSKAALTGCKNTQIDKV